MRQDSPSQIETSNLEKNPANNPKVEAKADDNTDPFAGPAWNNFSEYPSRSSNEFTGDRAAVEMLIAQIVRLTSTLQPLMERALAASSTLDFTERDSLVLGLQAISELHDQATTIFMNLKTYVNCETCIDGQDSDAKKAASELLRLGSRLEAAAKPSWLFLQHAPETLLTRYLQHPHTEPEAFSLHHDRKRNDTLLSEKEELLLTNFRPHGLDAWGELYNQISGTLRCSLEPGTELGLAQASGLLRSSEESQRQKAWHAIQNAWTVHEQSCAAIVNGLAGWRLEMNEKRSRRAPVNFLDQPLHMARIERETLEAMFTAVRSQIEVPRRAMRALARGLGKNQLDPWDLMAPPPSSGVDSRRSFKEALQIVRDGFANVDSGFGDFVSTMEKNRWLEGRILPNKRNGAFCTRFAKSRSPRVYQTYMGTIADIRTLAHELGHAYHGWVMRDLPGVLHRYPMTLAETASVFAETVFSDHMMKSQDPHARFEIAWQNAETATSFLLNIPSRFEFEREFYERRAKSFVTADDLCELSEKSWMDWYGDTLSQYDRRFWQTKLHFSIAGLSFYNFPYTFGYLFSLGIYALKEKLGPDFMPKYIAILRDTGRMTAEDLVMIHLGEDIRQPEFWLKSLAIVEKQIRHFETQVSAGELPRLRQ